MECCERCREADKRIAELDAKKSSAASACYAPEVFKLIEAAKKIRHWHDTCYNPETQETEGMVVSAKAVRELWEALEIFGG